MEGSNYCGNCYKTQHSYPRSRLITWRRPEVKFGRNVVKEETTQKLPRWGQKVPNKYVCLFQCILTEAVFPKTDLKYGWNFNFFKIVLLASNTIISTSFSFWYGVQLYYHHVSFNGLHVLNFWHLRWISKNQVRWVCRVMHFLNSVFCQNLLILKYQDCLLKNEQRINSESSFLYRRQFNN